MYHNPYPVVPTINSGNATPVNATYYAGNCAANAAISLPMADADAWAPFNEPGFSDAHFHDVGFFSIGANASGNQDANGSTGIWEQGNYTGGASTFDDLRFGNMWGGFLQGPAAVNQHGVRTVGPTSTGQSISNCTIRAGYNIALVNMQQSNINRCDTYSTEVSQYDGAIVGSSLGLFIGNTVSEQDGGGVTGMLQFSVRDFNDEPEGGTHEEIMPSVISDGTNITWDGDIFEGSSFSTALRWRFLFSTMGPTTISSTCTQSMLGTTTSTCTTGPLSSTIGEPSQRAKRRLEHKAQCAVAVHVSCKTIMATTSGH